MSYFIFSFYWGRFKTEYNYKIMTYKGRGLYRREINCKKY